MGIGGLLFNTSGRITQRQFWQGVVVLVTIQIFYTVLDSYLPMLPRFTLGVFMFIALIWAYVGVYGKRLHDAGLSAWLYVVFLLGYLVFASALGGAVAEMFGADQAQYQADLEAQLQPLNVQGALEVVDNYNRQMRIPNVLSLTFLNVLVGLIPGLALRSDPQENMHGPPVQNPVEKDFE